jgi:hypothetical protein
MEKIADFDFVYEKKDGMTSNGPTVERTVRIMKDGQEIGYFSIEGLKSEKTNDCFDSGNVCSMNISVDEEYRGKAYEGKRLSRWMIYYMTKKIREDYPRIRDEQLLFIDSDASGGFWEKIGMENHEFREHNPDINVEGNGYEKCITFHKLELFGKGKEKQQFVTQETGVSDNRRSARLSAKAELLDEAELSKKPSGGGKKRTNRRRSILKKRKHRRSKGTKRRR